MTTKGVLRHGWWLENPDLGAPFGQELYDFPNLVGHSFNLLLIKLLGVFSSDPALVTNLFFLLSFPLVALASFVVLRQIGISGGASLVCSVLYALAPYHFLRGENHLHLAAYYSVPVGAYLVLSLLSGRLLFTRRRGRTGGPRLLAWASKRSVVTLTLCLFLAVSGGPYYAVFTGLLLLAAMVLMFVIQRDGRALVQGSVLLVAIFGFLMLDGLPCLMYWFANGPNPAILRGWQDSEKYSLDLAQLVIPAPGHQVDALSNLAEEYHESTLFGEGPSSSLGFITTLGFAWLLLVALAGCLSPRVWIIGDPRHRQLATATVIAFLVGTTGGISVLFTALVSNQIRGWARISILIAFFAITAVGLLIDALGERIRVRRGHPVLVRVLLLLSVLLIGLYDQANNKFVPNYSAAKAEYQNDAALVRAIDHELPPQAQVLQLPYEPFPEESIEEMPSYSHLSLYMHESDLRWSYGAVKGRPNADWQADLADKPAEDLVATAIAKGFDGIYIDRFGYPERDAKLEGELGELLEVEPVVSADGRKSLYSLVPYKEGLQSRTSL
jgi:phosphoglycerol transferase